MARRERLRVLVRSKSFIAGAIIVGFWVICAIFGELLVLQDPLASEPAQRAAVPERRLLVRHRPARPRRVLARHRRRAGHHDHRARRDAARHGPRHRARACHRLLPRRRRRRAEPPHRGRSSRCRSCSSASLALVVARPVERHDHHRRRLRLRPDHRAHGARRGADASASSSTSARRDCATRTTPYIMFARDPAERDGPDRRRVHRPPRLRDLRGRDADASSASASSRRRPTGGCRSSSTTA